jgi:hypothetical protein
VVFFHTMYINSQAVSGNEFHHFFYLATPNVYK